MGLIKALTSAVGGSLADQWLEVIEPDEMNGTTVCTRGVTVRANDKRGSNKKGTQDTVSNGSIIQVYPNQCMLLVDGGQIVDFTTEEGYYKVDNSSLPSLFAGQFGDAIKETFDRFRYGGVTPTSQKVYYINLQEIKGIKFGTKTPVNYFDNFYNAELFLRTHGDYSIKITDPILFFKEALPRSAETVDINDINEQYLSEFLQALQASINQMSADGIRISFVASKGNELSRYMNTVLDEEWSKNRGFAVQSVGIASISYDDESTKLINMRNSGAMLSDAGIREGYVQGAVARGIESAGANEGGSANAFMGMGFGMNAAGGFMGSASDNNNRQMQMDKANSANNAQTSTPANSWKCACGKDNTGKFCSDCGTPKPVVSTWKCACGKDNTGKFCSDCGTPKPLGDWKCTCGKENSGKFCSDCGTPRP